MTTIEKIKKELEAFEEKKKAFVEDLRKEFPTMFEELFEKYPKIESIGWNQYTPYFNDGDECTFGVHTDYLYVNGEHEEEIEALSEEQFETITAENLEAHKLYNKEGYYSKRKIGDFGCFPNPLADKQMCDAVKEFKSVIQSIPDEFMKELFGDHSQITLSKEGIKVENYDHD